MRARTLFTAPFRGSGDFQRYPVETLIYSTTLKKSVHCLRQRTDFFIYCPLIILGYFRWLT